MKRASHVVLSSESTAHKWFSTTHVSKTQLSVPAAAQFLGPDTAPLTIEAQAALELAVSRAPNWIYGRLTQVGTFTVHPIKILMSRV